jgi:hypothetical protein
LLTTVRQCSICNVRWRKILSKVILRSQGRADIDWEVKDIDN